MDALVQSVEENKEFPSTMFLADKQTITMLVEAMEWKYRDDRVCARASVFSFGDGGESGKSFVSSLLRSSDGYIYAAESQDW